MIFYMLSFSETVNFIATRMTPEDVLKVALKDQSRFSLTAVSVRMLYLYGA